MLWGGSAGFRSCSQLMLCSDIGPKANVRKSPSAHQECQRAHQSGRSALICSIYKVVQCMSSLCTAGCIYLYLRDPSQKYRATCLPDFKLSRTRVRSQIFRSICQAFESMLLSITQKTLDQDIQTWSPSLSMKSKSSSKILCPAVPCIIKRGIIMA